MLWNMRIRCPITGPMRHALRNILAYVRSTTTPWEAKIGLVVPRAPCGDTTGDASLIGGGGYSIKLMFWFQVAWSARVHRCATELSSTAKHFLHVNLFEFLVLLLEFAAVIQFFRDLTDDEVPHYFPDGIRPHLPVIHAQADNTTALGWLSHATSTSDQGQKLLGVFSAMLQLEEVGVNGSHLKGEDNDQADMISRPSDLSLSPSQLAEQLFQKYPIMRGWKRFLPSPELLQLLYSSLFTESSPTPVELPKTLGRFVTNEFIISSLPTV